MTEARVRTEAPPRLSATDRELRRARRARLAAIRRPLAGRRHLDELDLVRGLTMVGVVGVHTISWTTSGSSVGAGAVTVLLHFTRESFFALMAFVLVFSHRQRPTSWPRFWVRRYPFVAVPYVVWTLVYLAITRGFWQRGPATIAHNIGFALISGTAWYHLYFLLVTMQIYLLFPLVLALVRCTARHHGLLLAVSFVAQLVAMSLAIYGPSRQGSVQVWLWTYRNSLVVSYQFFVVLGAVAAWHVDEVIGWVRAHRRTVWIVLGATAVATQVWYFLDIAAGWGVSVSAGVFQPAEVIWSVAAIAGLLAAGCAWADSRARGRGGRVLPALSRHSFGIFLVHPLVINALVVEGVVGRLRGWLPDPLGFVVVWPLVLAIATAFAMLASRTPLALVLTGRPAARRG